MATLSTLKTHVVSELGLDSTNDDALLTEWANRAVRDVLIKTKCRVRELSMALTSGTDTYSLDANVLVLLHLWNTASNDDYPMERLHLDDINTRRLYGDSATAPARYYALVGNDLLIVYPKPGTGENIKGQYVPKPTEMSTGTHDPSTATYGGIPVEYHDAIELYMLYHAARYDNHQPSRFGLDYMLTYQRRVAEIRAELNKKGGLLLPAMQVNRRYRSRFRSAARDPSVVRW